MTEHQMQSLAGAITLTKYKPNVTCLLSWQQGGDKNQNSNFGESFQNKFSIAILKLIIITKYNHD